MSLPTDIELMERVRDGDVRQLAELFERHSRKLYNYYVRLTGKRELSEDFVQEVFLKILKYKHTFRAEGQFTTWMYSIAHNVRIDHHRKWKSEQPMNDEDRELATEDLHAHDRLEQEESVAHLEQALSKLSPDKREVLVLSRYQELKYEAIAEIVGCSVESVKIRAHRGIKELRKIFLQLSGEKANG